MLVWVSENPGAAVPLIASFFALVGSILGALISPLGKDWLHRRQEARDEKKRLQEERRGLVSSWRNMVSDLIGFAAITEARNVRKELIHHKDFLALDPHLEFSVRGGVTISPALSIGIHLPEPLEELTQEINRIEKEWGLV